MLFCIDRDEKIKDSRSALSWISVRVAWNAEGLILAQVCLFWLAVVVVVMLSERSSKRSSFLSFSLLVLSIWLDWLSL